MIRQQERVKKALQGVSDNVGHYKVWKQKPPYIVWAEELEAGGMNGNDRKQRQVIQGSIHLFTREEMDTPNKIIAQVLKRL